MANGLRSDSGTTVGHPTVSKYALTSPVADPSPPRLQSDGSAGIEPIAKRTACDASTTHGHLAPVPDVIVDPRAPLHTGEPKALKCQVKCWTVHGVMHVDDHGVCFQNQTNFVMRDSTGLRTSPEMMALLAPDRPTSYK